FGVPGPSTPGTSCFEIATDSINDPDGDYQKSLKFWFSADDATGLLYRHNTSDSTSARASLGSQYNFAGSSNFAQQASKDEYGNRLILEETFASGDKTFLQYRFVGDDVKYPAANRKGGYVLNIKQTKCRRTNGAALNDSMAQRGAVEYVILPYSKD